MEVLSGVSVDTFKILVWIVALGIGVLFLVGGAASGPLARAARVVTGLLAAAASYAGANVAVVFYILANATDPRWSVGKDPGIDSPELSAGPILQPITDTLNGILSTLTGGLNNVIAMKNAFLTIPDFIAAAGWAALLLLPLVLAVRVLGWLLEKAQAKQIARNTSDLADIRAHLGLAPFSALSRPAHSGSPTS